MNQPRFIQNLRRSVSLAFSVLLIVGGCDTNQSGVIDPRTDTPLLRTAFLTTTEINIDSLPPSNGRYSIVDTVRTNLDPRSISLGHVSVILSVFRPGEAVPLLSQPLHDDGVPPDARANDSSYATRFQFDLTRAQAGRYRIQISAQNEAGHYSNFIDLTLLLVRKNSKPQLLNVNAPDSVQIPARPQDTVEVRFTVSASDSDGLADIQRVDLRRLIPIDTLDTRLIMRDDGGLGPPFIFRDPNDVPVPRRSGDAVAGDGIFTITIPLLFSSTARTSLFGFQAADSFSDTSATLDHETTFFRRP